MLVRLYASFLCMHKHAQIVLVAISERVPKTILDPHVRTGQLVDVKSSHEM